MPDQTQPQTRTEADAARAEQIPQSNERWYGPNPRSTSSDGRTHY